MLHVENLKRLMIGPVSFEVKGGECVAITGPSGAGKSVLLRSIADLDPNSGEVTAQGVQRSKITAPEWRKQVAMLPAESGWWAEQVGAHFQNLEAVKALLPKVALSVDAMGWEVARLSTGEKHRLALLRCLEADPKVLLLDEPTAALDHETTLKVEALLGELLAKGTSILIVTHDSAQAKRLADRTMHLEDGILREVAA